MKLYYALSERGPPDLVSFLKTLDWKLQQKILSQFYVLMTQPLPTEPTVKHLAIEKHSKLYELRARSVVMVRITFTIQRDGSILFLVPFIKRHTRNTVQALDASLNVLKQVSSGLCGIHEVPISRLLENASADSGKVPTNGTQK